MAEVQIEKVVKFYGSFHAIKGVDIAIDDGDFVVLVGPSGCGKSTLLRMIAGLESITDGTISIGGNKMNNVAAKHRNIAMVFQSYALYPHMTVRENMSFALKLLKRPKADIEEHVRHAAGVLGLEQLLDRYPRQLSGGQRQRVAMGRAIVRDPSVFLFDEPLSNLDAKLRVAMRTEIKSLHQRLGTTMIYVTHDQIEAMTMADKIVVMNAGEVEQIGAPLELYDNPRNKFVAGFLGSPGMNFVDGTFADGAFVSQKGLKLDLPSSTPAQEANKPATYGIRPEFFSIADEGLPLEVDIIEPTGSETLVMGHVDGEPMTATFRERVRAQPRDVIKIKPDYTKAHVFSADTGSRICGAIAS